MEGPLWVAKLVDAHFVVVEGILDPRRSFGAIGHGDHHWRGPEPGLGPILGCFEPVVSQKVVAVDHQVGQRLLRLRPPVQVILDFGIVVDVVEAVFVSLGVRYRIVADHHARRLDQPGLDGVVQPEITHDPGEQRLLGAFLTRRREGGGGEVVAGEYASRFVDSVEAADPFGCFLDLVLVTPLTLDSAGTRQA